LGSFSGRGGVSPSFSSGSGGAPSASFAARAASRLEEGDPSDGDAEEREGAPRETGDGPAAAAAAVGRHYSKAMRHAVSMMPQDSGRRFDSDEGSELRRSRSAPRPAHARYEEHLEEEEEEIFEVEQSSSRRVARPRGASGLLQSDKEYRAAAAAAAADEGAGPRRMDSLPRRDAREAEAPSFETLVQRQKSQQVLLHNPEVFSPL